MPLYRAYHLDRTRRVIDRLDLSCADDQDAKEQGTQLVYEYDVELWQGSRKIAVFRARDQEPR
jgi:hypothetical protein